MQPFGTLPLVFTSHLCSSVAEKPLATYSIYLCLNYLIYKMATTEVSKVAVRIIKWINACKALTAVYNI